jgi:hypothetical protein
MIVGGLASIGSANAASLNTRQCTLSLFLYPLSPSGGHISVEPMSVTILYMALGINAGRPPTGSGRYCSQFIYSVHIYGLNIQISSV